MLEQERILFTGGSGLLGSEMKKLFPKARFPSHQEFDVTNYTLMEAFTKENDFQRIVHAAAFTSPPKIDKNPVEAIESNIIGTANVTKLCIRLGIKLIYISTDYVFKGDKGQYKEEDPVYPVNKYAWSKLGGECAVHLHDNAIIIRTSFGPNAFPYEKAFVDQWTSRESVKEIATKIAKLVNSEITGVIHIGARRRTVFEYAKSLDPTKEVKELTTKEVNFVVPKDTSLDCRKYDETIG
ncbi:MAG: SDR family oxidoreductase [Candidatus Odinarchaeota archaeon]